MKKLSGIPGYFTVAEAASVIGVDSSQVRRYCIGKKLPAVKVGQQWLIRCEAVRNFDRPPVGNPEFQKHYR